MIIRPREPELKVADFLSGLQRAARSTVRFTRNAEQSKTLVGSSTGWLLTDQLVVTLWSTREAGWIEYKDEHGSLLQVEAEAVPYTHVNPEQPSLLRLSRKVPGREVTMSTEDLQPGDPVFILHLPPGEFSEQLSLGRVVELEGSMLRYDANTTLGSGGAPVFDSRWRLIGMHHGHVRERNANFGLKSLTIIDHLRGSSAWPEIAAYHRIADVQAAREHLALRSLKSAARQPPDDALLGAAVRWSVDPTTLSEEDATRLRKLVINPSAPRWILRADERQRLLRSAGSLERLRAARGTNAVPERGQGVIDQVLAGPPYELETASEEALSDWLQVSRWFADVAPSLPTPNEINRTLERRRLRSRLERIAGPGFKGRQKELVTLRFWYSAEQSGPMVVTGIGGMGKSALVARFASELPPDELLFWLDFDRADLAPDDAVSVLEALGEQAAAQVDGLQPPRAEPENWKDAAQQLGKQLAGAAGKMKRAARPLLVLDSFEVAQYAERYQELWPVLEMLSAEVPGLRVLVTGRAAVKNLVLQGRPAASLHLGGLERQDAEAWLREKGIQEDAVVERVLELAMGVPLILVLAVRLVEAGGKVTDLPRTLPQKVIEGVLYQRILDRVQDFTLRPLAMGALVLRRLTADMIRPVLGGLVELPERMSADLLAELAKEMALVEGTDVLRLRADVRSATLRLLEQDKPELVWAIDERAAAWYASQDLNDPAIAAELIYHRLRVGDLEGAAAAWRDEYTSYFQFEEDDLPEGARAWLRERLGGVTGSAPPALASWEREAVKRIRDALARGLWRALPEILGERTGRSAGSPLVFFDAYARWRAGSRAAAQKVLDEAGESLLNRTTNRNRAALSALLAAKAGDRRTADAWLARIDRIDLWDNRAEGYLESQAVRAARVRLTVDLPGEIELLGLIDGRKTPDLEALRRLLPSADVVLPRLRELLTQSVDLLEALPPPFGIGADDLSALEEEIARSHASSRVSPDIPMRLASLLPETDDPMGPWTPDELPPDTKMRLLVSAGVEDTSTEVQRSSELGLHLMLLGLRRWRRMLSDQFLSKAYILAAESPNSVRPLLASVAGTLTLLGGKVLGRELLGPVGWVADVVGRCLTNLARFPVREKRLRFALEVLRQATDPETVRLLDSLPSYQDIRPDDLVPDDMVIKLLALLRSRGEPAYISLAYHLLTPDPLERLVHQLAGIPSSEVL